MRAKLESGASFSFVWLTILIILLIPIFAQKFLLVICEIARPQYVILAFG